MNTKQDTSEESCEHEWYKVSDWEGSQDVINGVNHFYFFRCSKCREEVGDLPKGQFLYAPY